MKATELRIGNYFKPDMFGGAEYDMVTADDIVRLYDDPQEDYYQPLPLTPEILEKCGFDNIDRTNIFVKVIHSVGNNKLKSLTIYLDEENYTVAIVDYYTGVEKTDLFHLDYKHLHQLQNLYFALTGEELTVNL